MKNDLVPPTESSPPSVGHLSFADRIRLWAELVDENEAFLIAGLKSNVGKGGDWQEAYRQWYARRMEEHERTLARVAENLTRREAANDQ